MTTDLARFDLASELDRMRASQHAATPHHVAKTLVRSPDLRVVLIALDAGADVAEHRADSAITLQVLDGRICLTSPGSELQLAAGTVATLDRGVRHALHAIERSSVLLSLGWTGHRGEVAA